MERHPVPHTPPLILQLDENASAMLDLLVELGHLDEKLLAAVNDHLLDLKIPDGKVSADDVRRVVAELVFDQMDTMENDFRLVLESEWGMLFH